MNDLTLRLHDHQNTSAPERALVYEIRNQVRTHNARLDGHEPDQQALYRGIMTYLTTAKKAHTSLRRVIWFRVGTELQLRDASREPYRTILTVSQGG